MKPQHAAIAVLAAVGIAPAVDLARLYLVKSQFLIVDSGHPQNRKFQFLRKRGSLTRQCEQRLSIPDRVAGQLP